jgi:tetratricopeptide (TPR) repeat protein
VRVSVITSNLGTNFFRKGDYLQARQFYEQALAMDRQLGQFNGIGTNLGGIGITYYNQADYEKCVFYCEQALEIAREMGAQADMARHLGNMAASHQMLGNWLEAEEYFKAAIEMRRKIGLTANLAQLLGNFAHFLSRYGKHEGALSAIDEALLIIENIPHSFFHIQVFFYEGEVSFLAGDFARAKKAFEKYLELSNPEYGAERIFEVGLRLQKIQFKLASGDEARRRVEGMLPKAITPRQQALTHLELWRMGAGEAHREAAIALITELFGKTKDVEYREYLEELGADPAG